MEFIDFLNSEKISLPKQPNENSFLSFVECINNDYLELIHSLSERGSIASIIKSNLHVIEEICLSTQGSIGSYINGFTQDAYLKIENVINKHWEIFETLISIDIEKSYLDTLYRIRSNDTPLQSKEDLFHVPFELRTKISTQRYSILGFPCLYLGSSLLISWLELNKPKFKSLNISRFEASESVKILDFGYSPNYNPKIINLMNRRTDKNKSLIQNFSSRYILWPLLAACSITVHLPENPFKPEYIVPQLLLQYVRKVDNIDGIRYFSTKSTANYPTLWMYSNYVFPSKESKDSGFCDSLKRKFKLTEPLCWCPETYSSEELKKVGEYIVEINGVRQKYLNTDFGKIQAILNSKEANFIGS